MKQEPKSREYDKYKRLDCLRFPGTSLNKCWGGGVDYVPLKIVD